MGRQQILPQIGFVSQKIASGEFAPRERHNSRRSAPQTIELQIFDRVAVEIIRDGANFRSIYRCNSMGPVQIPLDLGIAAVYFPLIANFGSVEIVRNLRGFGGLKFRATTLVVVGRGDSFLRETP